MNARDTGPEYVPLVVLCVIWILCVLVKHADTSTTSPRRVEMWEVRWNR